MKNTKDAEIAALRREDARLQNPELPEYVRLVSALTAGTGVTSDLRIDLAMDMQDFAEFHDMPMCRDMVQAYFEYWEGRARANVAESRLPAIILAFRARGTLS